MASVKFLACQALSINHYKNLRNKIMKCCANIYLNPLNAELNPICHLLALLGAHHILHVCRIRVNPPMPKKGSGFQIRQYQSRIHFSFTKRHTHKKIQMIRIRNVPLQKEGKTKQDSIQSPLTSSSIKKKTPHV